MRYSLASRFQGGWLGSVLGEGLIEEKGRWRWRCYPETLWTMRGMYGGDRAMAEMFSARTQVRMTQSAIAVLVLPLILLHYDDPEELQSRLVEAIAPDFAPEIPRRAGASTPEWVADVWVWSHALALVLLDTLAPDLFLTQLYDRTRDLPTPLVSAIAALPQMLHEPRRARMLQSPSSLPLNADQQTLAWALLSFAMTPESWSVAMRRSRAIAKTAALPWLPALVGAISGCYNGVSGLPFRQLRCLPESIKEEICQESQQLLTIWSGSLLSQPRTAVVGAIAPGGKLQKRRSRPVISQKTRSRTT
ncbi:MAG: hypothetical protein SAJ12_16425 [Jaaginema sp. PMC 1079.18]|nr:hypothetical protein [Jaaginema sp. PMC 1080.18]MEC4852571.1 hypothetical protein [Jaaginema sp. PMC 1079.18]MEC4867870.1 hypothetical protein [Jaaginema sp. PMC 1078.18]